MRKIIIAICCLAIVANFGIFAYAQESKFDAQTMIKLCQNIDEIEKYLGENNSSVLKELNDFRMGLEELSFSASKKNLDTIQQLISQTDRNIETYCMYKEYRNENLLANSMSVYDPTYSAAVILIIAYFNSQGYKLSAELLTHEMDNSTLNSYYYPVYGTRVLSSPLFNSICTSGTSSGSGEFLNSGTTIQKDLYYGIHLFDYTLTNTYSGLLFTLTDRYDYTEQNSYTGLTNAALNTMHYAELLGVVVPFYTIIELDF